MRKMMKKIKQIYIKSLDCKILKKIALEVMVFIIL